MKDKTYQVDDKVVSEIDIIREARYINTEHNKVNKAVLAKELQLVKDRLEEYFGHSCGIPHHAVSAIYIENELLKEKGRDLESVPLREQMKILEKRIGLALIRIDLAGRFSEWIDGILRRPERGW